MMIRRQLRIRLDSCISDETAAALGARRQHSRDGCELVLDYSDQAQVTGLVIQLSDLHITYDRIEICADSSCRE